MVWLSAGEKGVFSHESALLLYSPTDLWPMEIHLTVPRTDSLVMEMTWRQGV